MKSSMMRLLAMAKMMGASAAYQQRLILSNSSNPIYHPTRSQKIKSKRFSKLNAKR
jgi:hypothetical protein